MVWKIPKVRIDETPVQFPECCFSASKFLLESKFHKSVKIFYLLAISLTVVCGEFYSEGGWKCWVTGHRKPSKLFLFVLQLCSYHVYLLFS